MQMGMIREKNILKYMISILPVTCTRKQSREKAIVCTGLPVTSTNDAITLGYVSPNYVSAPITWK